MPVSRLPRLTALAALLYAALAGFANPAHALGADDLAGLSDLRAGEMRKLLVADLPRPASDVAYLDPEGRETTLAASNGRIRVVNFWATWCAPCRQEMPSLDRLEAIRGGTDFAVITIATGRNSPEGIADFRETAGISLPTALDPKGALARDMNVPGLPVTVILDRDGTEIARLLGGAEWDGPDAAAVFDYLADLPATE